MSTPSKSSKLSQTVIVLVLIAGCIYFVYGFFIKPIQENRREKQERIERAEAKANSLSANTQEIYKGAVVITEVRIDLNETSFTIWDGLCTYTSPIGRSESGQWTLIPNLEYFEKSKITKHWKTVTAQPCPAKPLSSDFDQLFTYRGGG